MGYPVRRLSTVGPGVVVYSSTGPHPDDLSARAGAVFDVDATELELNVRDITTQLDAGTLKTTDLVYENGAWTTFAQSVTFGAAAGGKALGEGLSRNLKFILLVLGFFAMWGLGILLLSLHKP